MKANLKSKIYCPPIQFYFILEIIISCIIYLFLCYGIYSDLIYGVSLAIFYILKKLRNVSFFSPEYAFLFAYTIFFGLPFYFYDHGYLLTCYDTVWAMKESFTLYLVLNLISVLFFHRFSTKKHFFIFSDEIRWDISFKKLVYINTLFLMIRILLLLGGYKTNAISSLDKSSILDIIYIPIFQGSLLLFFLSLWQLIFFKRDSFILKFQVFLFLVLDILYLSKGRLLLDIFCLMIIMYRKYRRIPIRILLLPIFLIYIYLPIAQYFRFKHARNLHSNITDFLDKVYSNFNLLINLLLGRLNMVEPFSRLLNIDPNKLLTTYPLNNTFFPFLFISLVPKFLWTNRPDSSIGGLVGYYLGYISNPKITQVTISILGEFFLNFRQNALFYIALYAIFINIIYFYLLHKRRIIYFFLAIFFYFFNIFTGFESYFVLRVAIFLKLFIIYLGIYQLVRRKKLKIFLKN